LFVNWRQRKRENKKRQTDREIEGIKRDRQTEKERERESCRWPSLMPSGNWIHKFWVLEA